MLETFCHEIRFFFLYRTHYHAIIGIQLVDGSSRYEGTIRYSPDGGTLGTMSVEETYFSLRCK